LDSTHPCPRLNLTRLRRYRAQLAKATCLAKCGSMGRLPFLFVPVVLYSLHVLHASKVYTETEADSHACDVKDGLQSEDTSLLQLIVDSSSSSESGAAALLQKTKSLASGAALTTVSKPSVKANQLDGEVSDRGDAVDWLYTSTPNSCTAQADWDMTQYALTSRVFLPVMFLFLIAFVVLNGKQQPEGSSASSADAEEIDSTERPQRLYYLDFARIVCVACVVTEHSGGSAWTKHNVLFVLQWVLPYLYIVSAISWMMSKKGVWDYIARLSIVLAVGVGANWVSDEITGRNWQGDFGNTIYQMFYVVMLILMSLLTAPLRQAFLWRKNHPEPKPGDKHPAVGWQLWTALVIYGLLTFVGFLGFLSQQEDHPLITISGSSWWAHLAPTLNNAPVAVIQVAGAMFLCLLACLFKANDIFPWLLLVHIYLPRIFIPWDQVGFLHNLELFIFAMAAESWKLRGQKAFAKVVQNYWPIIIFWLMIATMPDTYGRCDTRPPASALERLRFYGIELVLCLLLTTGSIKVADPYRLTEWLNYWALYAYCFHVAWARLFPIPYGAVISYGSAAIFYLAWRLSSNGEAAGRNKGDELPPRKETPTIA